MYHFVNDYSEGAHPRIMQALLDTNMEQTSGYGYDPYTRKAADLIREKCACPDADVHFLVGGTQVNLVCIHAFLHSFQAVITVDTAHVCVHETGAIESTGHRICCQPSSDGKVTPQIIESILHAHNGTEHMVQPKLVYISDTTELGTAYSREELSALRKCCDANDLYMYCDGARLACGLTAKGGEMTLSEFARYFDAFTIGGTKNGMLFGEALVLRNKSLGKYYRCYMKQRGAMLAKGRLLGIQFYEMLRDDLYFDLGRHANACALRIRRALEGTACRFVVDSPSNQQFVCIPRAWFDVLSRDFKFEDESTPEDPDGFISIRICTSWATTNKAVDSLVESIEALKAGK